MTDRDSGKTGHPGGIFSLGGRRAAGLLAGGCGPAQDQIMMAMGQTF